MVANYFEKPKGVDAKDTGRVVSILYLVTLSISLFTYVFFFSGPVQRAEGCSAFFPDSMKASSTNTTTTSNSTVFSTETANSVLVGSIGSNNMGWDILQNRYTLVAFIVLVSVLLFKAQRYTDAREDFFDYKYKIT